MGGTLFVTLLHYPLSQFYLYFSKGCTQTTAIRAVIYALDMQITIQNESWAEIYKYVYLIYLLSSPKCQGLSGG